jgi:hypothetical protein
MPGSIFELHSDLVHPDKHCEPSLNIATITRNVSRQKRNGTTTFATPLYDHVGLIEFALSKSRQHPG